MHSNPAYSGDDEAIISALTNSADCRSAITRKLEAQVLEANRLAATVHLSQTFELQSSTI